MRDRSTRAALPIWVVAGFVLTACGSREASAVDSTSAGSAQADPGRALEAPASAGDAEPVTLSRQGYKSEQVRLAMRGLFYGTGPDATVAVDPEQTLVEVEDLAASATAVSEGYELIGLNRRNEALATMTRAVLLAPENPWAYEGLGDALVVRRKYEEAGAAFRTGLALAPDSAQLNHKLGDILVRLDDRSTAVGLFQRALELDPDHAPARERLALQLYYLGRSAEAWAEVHAAEARGDTVPPQFRALLAGVHPEPPR